MRLAEAISGTRDNAEHEAMYGDAVLIARVCELHRLRAQQAAPGEEPVLAAAYNDAHGVERLSPALRWLAQVRASLQPRRD